MSDNKIEVQVLQGNNKLSLAKLHDILRRKLVIPSYQRPYAWGTDDIEEIFSTISSTQEEEENICFFGSIILSKKSNGFAQEEYYIIDGQQRISSFLLIIRVFLDSLNKLIEDIKKISEDNKSKDLLRKEIALENKKKSLEDIINIVSLKREQSKVSDIESHILKFIKEGGSPKNSSLENIINTVYTGCDDKFSFQLNERPETENIINYTENFIELLDFILNKIKFCLICITGENSENFVVNLFNTLNTTGQPLTAFEVLKSELYTIQQDLSEKIDNLQLGIIRKYASKRKAIISHTGKLLLYLPLYRGDFKENGYVLSDKKFKDQRGYLKEILDKDSAPQIVKDIQIIDNFYSNYWLKTNSLSSLLRNKDEQICFRFLSELKHDRVLPILIRFHESDKDSLGKCVKVCTAFSTLWRAYHDGGTSGIDKAYKTISLDLKTIDLKNLNKIIKKLFFNKLSSDRLEELKNNWIQKLKTSSIYKNQKLSKLLLFLAYNQKYFNVNKKSLEEGRGIDILNEHYWDHSDYKTIEHIIPKTDKKVIGHIHTLGNLTLLPQALNSSLGDKLFKDKLMKYKKFCDKENEDKYPYLPIIKQIASYDQFTEKEIEERSKILSEFIWQTLAEDWLEWKD